MHKHRRSPVALSGRVAAVARVVVAVVVMAVAAAEVVAVVAAAVYLTRHIRSTRIGGCHSERERVRESE